ncbi:MAG: ATP-binding protein [Chryseobacterium sp.]|nr:ATP-binding protein [Chryseobacterium sp.]
MSFSEKVLNLIGFPENDELEYKAVLPPARTIARIISAFANSNGGILILGVVNNAGEIHVPGLSNDFNVNGVVHRAIDLLTPKPIINYDYITYGDKRIYAIQVNKSDISVSIEGKIYRKDERGIISTADSENDSVPLTGIKEIDDLVERINDLRPNSTNAKSKFVDHYQSVINIVSDSSNLLSPISITLPTTNQEGKILMRILFSSCADNFEIYLTDLLYEIYLAKPETLKSSEQMVTIKEVLDCSDMQEFVTYLANKKLSKLQRGSVKGFIADNKQISKLNVISTFQQEEIEKILQIRHLYAHKNGIIDEKFLSFYPGIFTLNDEHILTVEDLLKHFLYLLDTVDRIDKAAVLKYHLSTL